MGLQRPNGEYEATLIIVLIKKKGDRFFSPKKNFVPEDHGGLVPIRIEKVAVIDSRLAVV